jgi:hypothetical protein
MKLPIPQDEMDILKEKHLKYYRDSGVFGQIDESKFSKITQDSLNVNGNFISNHNSIGAIKDHFILTAHTQIAQYFLLKERWLGSQKIVA